MTDIDQAIKILNQGGIIIFPTDTAFGIGCRIDNERAVERLFAIRKRPEDMAAPVLFDSIERVSEYTLPLDQRIERLMHDHWPGALTIVLSCRKEKVPSLVRGGGKTLGVRVPDHQAVWQLVKGADTPILGPSANFHGEKTPYNFSGLDKRLIKLVDFVLEGETKGLGHTSTVVDCSNFPWKIIRQGVVKLEI